jgi:HTH-type transcriptional regulator/antitoxin HigA
MATEKQIFSNLPIPPGDFLAEVLAVKGISQVELGRRMGRPAQAINEIIAGKKAITPDTALQLERALGVPASIWTGLESRFQLIKARQLETKQLKKDLTYLDQIPYRELAKMGFVKHSRNKIDRVRELHAFYGVSALANMTNVEAYAAAFRCSRNKDASPYALAAWLKSSEMQAGEIVTKSFLKEHLQACLSKIRGFILEPVEEIEEKLQSTLADCGIAFVLMPHLPRTYAHGATFWLSSEKAVIVMSIRGSWADIFWFSLFHEIAHIFLHKKRAIFIDDDDAAPDLIKKEKEADEFAARLLIPQNELQKFLKICEINENTIREFSQRLKVIPGIVIGRLQHDGYLKQDTRLNRLRTRLEWKNQV